MTSEQFIKFREMIEREFSHAVTKHPKFCDLLVNNLSNWNRLEHMQKVVNSEPPFYGENILIEEVAEAFNAYSHGDMEHALQEFAQCGAVILRIMAKVDEEIQKEKHECRQLKNTRHTRSSSKARSASGITHTTRSWSSVTSS